MIAIGLDLETMELVNARNPSSALSDLGMRKDDVVGVMVYPFRDGERTELPAGYTMRVYLTLDGDYDQLLASDTSMGGVGSGNDIYYVATIDLTSLGGQFADGTVESILANLEAEITNGTLKESSSPVPVLIRNSRTS